jgi:hypothetical protein
MRLTDDLPVLVTPDHVAAATDEAALMYLGAVAMWLAGVLAIVIHKLRAA